MLKLKEYAAIHGAMLTDEMLAAFARMEAFMLEYNEKVNLTAITAHEDIIQKHFLDSLLALDAHAFPHGAKVIDIGTGAGYPGVPLKIARPDLEITLLDSLNKRIVYLEQLSELLGQHNTPVHARAEEAAHSKEYRERFDVAVSRAVANLPALCEYSLGFVRPGGVFLAMKGPDVGDELAAAGRALRELGGELDAVRSYKLPNGDERSIVVIKKISQTPLKYPRKAIKITKSPL